MKAGSNFSSGGGAALPGSVTICGSGNAGHALAVVASQILDVDWLVSSEEKAELLRANVARSGLRSTGAITAIADRIRTISSDPAEVIPEAGLVLIVVPAFAHGAVLRRIALHLTGGTAVGCLPTRGGFEFDALAVAGEAATIFGLQTLPWSTRVTSYGETAHVGAIKQQVRLAALPGSRAPALAAQLEAILGTSVIAAGSFLGLTLANPGQCIHPGLIYGHFRDWNGEEYAEDEIPFLYAQASEEVGAVVEGLSDDTIAVAEAIEAQSDGRFALREMVTSVHEWLRTVYGHVTADMSTVGSCFRTGPIQARKAPMLEVAPGRYRPNFQYRYLSEDVPYGLVATRALAQLAKVRTPMIDEVLTWSQSALEKVYLVGDELVGADAAELPLPQNHGIGTLSELIDWYAAEPLIRRGDPTAA
jgi:hypothetical protein